MRRGDSCHRSVGMGPGARCARPGRPESMSGNQWAARWRSPRDCELLHAGPGRSAAIVTMVVGATTTALLGVSSLDLASPAAPAGPFCEPFKKLRAGLGRRARYAEG